MTKLAVLIEAEKRGVLSGAQRDILLEARRRGLISEPKNEVADAIKSIAAENATLLREVVKAVLAQRAPVVNVAPSTATVKVDVPETNVNVEAVMPSQKQDHRGWIFTVERNMVGQIETIRAERD